MLWAGPWQVSSWPVLQVQISSLGCREGPQPFPSPASPLPQPVGPAVRLRALWGGWGPMPGWHPRSSLEPGLVPPLCHPGSGVAAPSHREEGGPAGAPLRCPFCPHRPCISCSSWESLAVPWPSPCARKRSTLWATNAVPSAAQVGRGLPGTRGQSWARGRSGGSTRRRTGSSPSQGPPVGAAQEPRGPGGIVTPAGGGAAVPGRVPRGTGLRKREWHRVCTLPWRDLHCPLQRPEQVSAVPRVSCR